MSLLDAKVKSANKDLIYLDRFNKKYPGENFENSIQKLLSPESIYRYSDGITYVAPLNLINVDKELITLEDILNGKFSRRSLRSFQLLDRGILPIINAAITQQSILAGDIIIPLMAKVVYESKSINDQRTVQLLENNTLLTSNFLKYMIKKELEKSGKSIYNYEVALKSKNIEYLKSLLTLDWKIESH